LVKSHTLFKTHNVNIGAVGRRVGVVPTGSGCRDRAVDRASDRRCKFRSTVTVLIRFNDLPGVRADPIGIVIEMVDGLDSRLAWIPVAGPELLLRVVNPNATSKRVPDAGHQTKCRRKRRSRPRPIIDKVRPSPFRSHDRCKDMPGVELSVDSV